MLRILTYLFVFFGCFSFLNADDRGFRFIPSFTSMAGTVDGKISMKTAVNAELTYVLFNQFEFGFGSGFHRQHLTQKREITFCISEDNNTIFSIPRAKANSMPYYALLRYSFDLFEEGYLVASVKYGSYFFIPRDRKQKGYLPSYPEEEGGEAAVLRYNNQFSKIQFFAVTLGYDVSNTVISLEYRVVNFNQDLSYINETISQKITNSYNKSSHYLGLNVAYKIDLF